MGVFVSTSAGVRPLPAEYSPRFQPRVDVKQNIHLTVSTVYFDKSTNILHWCRIVMINVLFLAQEKNPSKGGQAKEHALIK